jgi:predicted type IV restriction endonuclease
MDFIDVLHAMASKMNKQIVNIQTEEATKTAFVMPFIQALGYDVFDPTEVVPEFIADVGSKKGEKIDYAIQTDGKPTILFECKSCTTNLNDVHASQLRRYFHVTSARIGILTNGTSYMFFSDLEEPNIMDKKPFMEINMLDLNEELVPELKKLTKTSFELDKMLSTASNLKYTREIKAYLETQLINPTPEFSKPIISKVYEGVKTQLVVEQFGPIIRQAFISLINDHISARLKTALAGQIDSQPDVDNSVIPVEQKENKIETTQEEIEGFYIIRAILRQVADIERVHYRDAQSYFSILLDDSNRKTICRLHFNAVSQKYIGFIDEDKKEKRYPIASLNGIYDFADQIKASALLLLQQ